MANIFCVCPEGSFLYSSDISPFPANNDGVGFATGEGRVRTLFENGYSERATVDARRHRERGSIRLYMS